MATPLPLNDPAFQALQKKKEILAKLDAITQPVANAPASEKAAPEAPPAEPVAVAEAATEPMPETAPSVPFDKRIAYFRERFTEAADLKDAEYLRRIAGNAKEAIAQELTEREQQLQAAKDYFDAVVKDTGPEAPETQDAAQLVRQWQEAVDRVRAEQDDTEQFDAESVIASFGQSNAPETPAVPAAQEAPVHEEGPVTLEELRASKEQLDAVQRELIRLKNEVEIRIAKAEIGI